jgi:hypothetical protein
MEKKKNALEIAGNDLAEGQSVINQADLDLGMRIGRTQALHLMRAIAEVGQAREIKRVKESGEYKRTGLSWKQFCPVHLGVSHVTADAAISNLDTLGENYFAANKFVAISPGTFGLIAGKVDNSGIEIDGEHVPFTAANAHRIKTAIESIRKQAQTARNESEAAMKNAEIAGTERDNAKKAAAALRSKVLELQNPKDFADADPDHRALLRIQSNWDRNLLLLSEVGKRQLAIENEARYIGLLEYLYRTLMQVTDETRYAFGRGANAPDPSDALYLNNEPDTSRNLIAEFSESKKGGK